MKFVRKLLADRSATTAVEYALLAVTVSLVALSSINTISNSLVNVFVAVANDMSSSNSASL